MRALKRIILVIIISLIANNIYAQVSVASAKNKVVSNLVQSYLIGPNIVLVNDNEHLARFNEKTTVNSNQLGIFKNSNTTGCNIPMDTGLVITTCSYDIAGSGYGSSSSPSSNLSSFTDSTATVFQWTYTKYCIENNKTISAINDVGYLSFWIKPTIDNFQFSYCFASDEYPTYVGSNYNDFFGFYFSGPFDSVGNYIKGSPAYYMQNLALVPGTQVPVMINTVNHGGGYSSASSYPEYHIVPSGSCKNSCNFNQWTIKLPTATTIVIKDAYYKIDILICNISDNSFNSGLYLSKDMRRFDTINIDTAICDNDVYYYNGKGDYLSVQGKYQIVYENITGGDSIININLKVNSTFLDNYCWELLQGETIEVDDVVISVPGSYIFKYQTESGCDSTVVYNVEYGAETKEVDCIKSDTVSNLSNIQDEIIKIYPNPVSDFVYIENLPDNSILELYNINGILVKKSNRGILNISELESGIYYMRIISSAKVITKKIIKS